MRSTLHVVLGVALTVWCASNGPLSASGQVAPVLKTRPEGTSRPEASLGPLDILTDTRGVDFGPYLQGVLHTVRSNWYLLMPSSAHGPENKQRKVSIEFAIQKNGKVVGMEISKSSDDKELDRAAWGSIVASNPFAELPKEFDGQYIALRFHFCYNPDPGDPPKVKPRECKLN